MERAPQADLGFDDQDGSHLFCSTYFGAFATRFDATMSAWAGLGPSFEYVSIMASRFTGVDGIEAHVIHQAGDWGLCARIVTGDGDGQTVARAGGRPSSTLLDQRTPASL